MKTKLLLFLLALTLSLSAYAPAHAQKVQSAAIVVAPVQPMLSLLVRTNFPIPEIGEDGFPTGRTIREDFTVATWQAIYEGAGWDVMYRTNAVWLKPAQVLIGRDLKTGLLRKSIFLPYREDYTEAYEFMWIVTLNPLAQ